MEDRGLEVLSQKENAKSRDGSDGVGSDGRCHTLEELEIKKRSGPSFYQRSKASSFWDLATTCRDIVGRPNSLHILPCRL